MSAMDQLIEAVAATRTARRAKRAVGKAAKVADPEAWRATCLAETEAGNAAVRALNAFIDEAPAPPKPDMPAEVPLPPPESGPTIYRKRQAAKVAAP